MGFTLALRGRITVTLLLLLLAACGKKVQPNAEPQKDAASATQKVRLALNWVPEPEFGGFYAAREAGSYQKRALEVEILGGGAGVPVVQMVATGRADFGTVGADELITARARGADVVAVFAAFQTSPQGIMVHAARKLTKLEDAFKSGTLALETGVAYAAFLKRKFSWDGVKIVPYDGGVARFVADPSFAQQCYVTSEPIAAKRKGSDPQVFLIADAGYNPYTTVVVTSRAFLDKNPRLVRDFVIASREGWQTYLDHPAATNQLLARLNPAMDAETFAAATEAQKSLIETPATRHSGLGSMQRERWDTLARQLVELKLIDKSPNVDELFIATPPKSE